jgi:hypothetical protein
MNVLEKIAKNLQECTTLGLSASEASSLSIYGKHMPGNFGCTMLMNIGTQVPEIIKNEWNREVISGLHYYTHPDYTTTFVFSSQTSN